MDLNQKPPLVDQIQIFYESDLFGNTIVSDIRMSSVKIKPPQMVAVLEIAKALILQSHILNNQQPPKIPQGPIPKA